MNFCVILFGIISLLQGVAVITANPEKCFEVLNLYSSDDIKTIFDMNLRDTILTPPANDIFDCFLTKSSHGDESTTKKLFKIYIKLEKDKRDPSTPLDNAKLVEIVSMGLPINLESALKKNLQQGKRITLTEAQNMIGNEIELSGEYTTYRKHIEKELKEQETHDKINAISWIFG